ncbi:MAG: hypothetical protein KC457_11280, partial [Myxococcales bacterium]|nr:hypothetical protein [Myxococcales bacterium]
TEQVGLLGAGGKKQVLVVSAAPVLGHTLIEDLQRAGVAYENEKKHPGDEIWDNEPWGGNATAFIHLLDALGPHAPVVFLSGDVHYAFSSLADVRLTDKSLRRYIQLVSSSTKNAEFKTNITTLLSTVEDEAELYYAYYAYSLIGPDFGDLLTKAALEWVPIEKTLKDGLEMLGVKDKAEWLVETGKWALSEGNSLWSALPWPQWLPLGIVPIETVLSVIALLDLDEEALIFAARLLEDTTGVTLEAMEEMADDVGEEALEAAYAAITNPLDPCARLLLAPPVGHGEAPIMLPRETELAARWRELGTIGTTNIGMVRFRRCAGARYVYHDLLWSPGSLVGSRLQPAISTQHRVLLANPVKLGTAGGTP